MAFNPNTLTFDTIADLRTRGGTPGVRVHVLGYYTIGDGGGGIYTWNAASTATDNDGTIIKVTVIATGRWLLNYEGDINVATFGVITGDADENPQLVKALALTGLKRLVFNSNVTKDFTVDDSVTIPAHTILSFQNDCKLIGSGSITGGIIECDKRKQCIGTNLTVTGLENGEVSVRWFGAVNDYVYNVGTPTDNYPFFVKALSCTEVGGRIHIPASDFSTSNSGWYYLSQTWVINRTVEIYGDGKLASILIIGYGAICGIKTTTNVGLQYLHDFGVKGYPGQVSSAINSDTAHGIWINSPQCIVERVRVETFDGDGIRAQADVTGIPVTNANNSRVILCDGLGNGRAGFYNQGGDGNAIYVEAFNAVANARWGIWNGSFLGDVFVNCHVASNMNNHNYNRSVVVVGSGNTYWSTHDSGPGTVSHLGTRYHAILPSGPTPDVEVEPGVTAGWATYWTSDGAGGVDSTHPAWQASTHYITGAIQPEVTSGWQNYWITTTTIQGVNFPSQYTVWNSTTQYYKGGGYYVEDGNACSVYIGCYIEGDQPRMSNNSRSMAFGGFLAEQGQFQGAIGNRTSVLTSTNWQSIDQAGNSIFQDADTGRLVWQNAGGGNWGFKGDYSTKITLCSQNLSDVGIIFYSPQVDYSLHFGLDQSPSFRGYAAFLDGIYMGGDGGGVPYSNFNMGPAMPTTGTFKAGAWRHNITPGSAIIGWRSTVASVADDGGTWEALYGLLSDGSYIKNQTTIQAGSNFYASGNGIVGNIFAVGDTLANISMRIVTASAPSYANAGGTGDRTATITVTSTLTTGGSGGFDIFVNGLFTNTIYITNAQAVSGKILKFDFGSGASKVINEAKYYQDVSQSQGIWKWQGSNDNSTWTDVSSSFTLGTGATQIITALSGNSSGYRYYRLLGISGVTSDNSWQREFEFKIDDYSSTPAYGSIQTYQTDGMTSGLPLLLQKDGGNVGIGNIAPGKTLDVTGTFRTSGINTLTDLVGTGDRIVKADSSGVLGLFAAASGGGATNFLRADGTWAAPAGGTTIYTGNGTLTSDRTVDGAAGARALTFSGLKGFLLDSATVEIVSAADITLSGGIVYESELSPASLGADQNDYAPAGITTCNTLRLTSSANVNITGIGLTSGHAKIIPVHNIGTFNITFKKQDAGSTAIYRFAIPTDITLLPDESTTLQYDATSQRWRIL